MSKKWYDNTTVIITGASSGFGKLLAQKLVKNHNCKVIGIARTVSKLEDLKQELGENFSYYPFDVSDNSKWEELYKTLTDNNISVDVLINNAGILPPFKKFENTTIESVEKVMQTNFFASIYAVKNMMPLIKKSPNRAIINISSSAALSTVVGTVSYSASKSALKSFTESLALENDDFYISLVCPGFAKTEIFRSQKQGSEKENLLLQKVCSNPEKIVNKLLKKLAKKKKRIVLGADAKTMDFFTRLFPTLTLKAIKWVLKKSKVSLFDEVFLE